MSNFDRFLSVAASTLRQPAFAGGVRPTAPTTKIPNLMCMALIPAGADVRLQIQTDAPMRLYETYVNGSLDILQGDVLVIATVQYQIKGVAPWTWSDGTTFLHLVLEKVNT